MGVGSSEGFAEARHWSSENGNPSKAEKEWVIKQIPNHIADPNKRAETRAWILFRGRSRQSLAHLCRRWGIELPSRF